jgi:hypothetical protein
MVGSSVVVENAFLDSYYKDIPVNWKEFEDFNVTDFQALIRMIEARGHSTGWIAMKCGVRTSTISMLKHREGREPKYNLGASLVQLEKETRND